MDHYHSNTFSHNTLLHAKEPKPGKISPNFTLNPSDNMYHHDMYDRIGYPSASPYGSHHNPVMSSPHGYPNSSKLPDYHNYPHHPQHASPNLPNHSNLPNMPNIPFDPHNPSNRGPNPSTMGPNPSNNGNNGNFSHMPNHHHAQSSNWNNQSNHAKPPHHQGNPSMSHMPAFPNRSEPRDGFVPQTSSAYSTPSGPRNPSIGQSSQATPRIPNLDNNANPDDQFPSDEQNQNYYHEFCRLYFANSVLNSQLSELMQEQDALMVTLTQLEKKYQDLQGSKSNLPVLDDKKRRFRRAATEIERRHVCPVASCAKCYGFRSEGSLNQHVKLKHPEIYPQYIKTKEEGSDAGSVSRKE